MNGSRSRAAALFAIVCLAASVPLLAGKTPAYDYSVTSVVDDASSDLLGTHPYSVRSDGMSNYANGSGVQSTVGGDWILDTTSKSTSRELTISLSEPVAGYDGTGRPFTEATVPVHLISKCYGFRGVDLSVLAQDQPTLCPLAIAFSWNGTNYRLAMNAPGTATVTNTNDAWLTCTNNPDGHCRNWTVVPSGGATGTDPNPKNQATLLKLGRNGAETPLGNFYVSFSMSMHK